MWQKLLMLLVTIGAVSFTGYAQWNLVKDTNGIQVYTAESGTSAVKSVKVVATVKGNCRKLVALFRDIPKQKQWVYATRRAYLINKISDNELLYYTEIALPWPARNRDAAIRMKINENASGTKATITAEGEPKAIPAKSSKIRVPQFSGLWEIETLEEGNLKIVYKLDLDPGGSLPAGIVNLFVTKGPYESIVNLASLLKE